MKYIHLRQYQNETEMLSKGGMTVGYIPKTVLEENQVQDSPNQVIYAIAYCNNQDTYSKKIGRAIVEGRMHKFLNFLIKPGEENVYVRTINLNGESPRKAVLNDLLGDDSLGK